MADKPAKTDAAASSSAAASVPPLATGAAAASAAAAASSTTGGAATPAQPSAVGAAAKPKAGSKPGAGAGGKKQQQAPPLTAEQSAKLAARSAADAAKAEAKRIESDLPHQTMIASRRADVRGRLDGLVSSLASLQSTLTQSETDSTDVLKYLESEVRRKDILTKQLAREIRELHAKQIEERAEKQASYTQEIQELERTFSQKESQLLDLNRLRHQEHSDLLLFARIRPELLNELAQTKRVILKNTQRHSLQMADLERKFLEARRRLMEESTTRIAEARRAYKEEVGRELDLESQWISQENTKMTQELSFHQTLIAKMEGDNTELRAIVAQLESSVHTLEKRDTDYAAAALRESKTIQEMQRKAAMIQASIQQIRAGESANGAAAAAASASAVTIASEDDQSLWALQTELQKLQGLTALKHRESTAISQQLSALQAQTNDVMRIALQALRDIKFEICARRKQQYQRDVAHYRQSLAELAKGMYQPQGRKLIGAGSGSHGSSNGGASGGGIEIQSDPRCPPPLEPQLDPRRLTLADFSVSDRERVLQLIFEALNRSNGVDSAAGGTEAAGQQKEDTRPSSAVSLYTGASRSGSSTSLVLSRPASSTRGSVGGGSRPVSSTRGSRPVSSTRSRPSPPAAAAPSALAAVDMRPSEYERLAGLAAAGGRAQKAQQLKHRRHGDEKETAFFPPRGDTPTELL